MNIEDLTSSQCPHCYSMQTDYDSTFGFWICEKCNEVWADGANDPDYDETWPDEANDLDYDELPPEDYGPCCACLKQKPTTRNLLMLPHRASVPGTGWGCIVCSLPPDGAVAIVCDDCLQSQRELQNVIFGYPMEKQRVGYEAVSHTKFKHTQELHEREEARINQQKKADD
jgi:hypothetical protein